MTKDFLCASYLNYKIEQVYKDKTYGHTFYINNKKTRVRSCSNLIPRSTSKQLYHYLRYLVRINLIDKFDKPVFVGDDKKIPYELNEYTDSIRYINDIGQYSKKYGGINNGK